MQPVCGNSKVIDTIPVPACMYHTSMYTCIEMLTFITNLNIGYTGQFRAILAGTQKKKKKILFGFVIFEFL